MAKSTGKRPPAAPAPSARKKSYWLLKSEPEAFSIAQLEAAADKTTCWDGVRNYQARNYLRDSLKCGDGVLFYHSNAAPPAIVGLARVVREAYPDHTAFAVGHIHHDPKSRMESPTWYMVDIQHVHTFAQSLPLDSLRTVKGLESMVLLQKGSRLSVQPVSPQEWAIICALAGLDTRGIS